MPLSATEVLRAQQNEKLMIEKDKVSALKWFEECYHKLKSAREERFEYWPENADLLYRKIQESKKYAEEASMRQKEIDEKEGKELEKIKEKLFEGVKGYGGMPGVMYDVPPEVEDILRRGTSHQGDGAKGYLKERSKVDPCIKYPLPLTSSQVYGWDITSAPVVVIKDFCKQSIIETQFYRRNGPEVDDPNQKKPYSNAQLAPESL